MFADISVFQFLIYAAGIGFAAAIVYTNIQRTALAKFVLYLLDNDCFNSDNACTLDDIGLNGIQKLVVSSAVNKQHGFKRCVSYICDTSNEKADDVFFEKNKDIKYFLNDCDKDELRKKYNYKTMPVKFVILFIVALCAVVVICSFLVNMLINSVMTPKMENNGNQKDEQTEELYQTDTGNNSSILEPEPSDENTPNEETDGPRIPI